MLAACCSRPWRALQATRRQLARGTRPSRSHCSALPQRYPTGPPPSPPSHHPVLPPMAGALPQRRVDTERRRRATHLSTRACVAGSRSLDPPSTSGWPSHCLLSTGPLPTAHPAADASSLASAPLLIQRPMDRASPPQGVPTVRPRSRSSRDAARSPSSGRTACRTRSSPRTRRASRSRSGCASTRSSSRPAGSAAASASSDDGVDWVWRRFVVTRFDVLHARSSCCRLERPRAVGPAVLNPALSGD
jgi:hypothetical protein